MITIPIVSAYTPKAREPGHLLLGLSGSLAPREYEDGAVYDADVTVRAGGSHRIVRTRVAVMPRILLAGGELVDHRHFIVLLDALVAASADQVEIDNLRLAVETIDGLRGKLV